MSWLVPEVSYYVGIGFRAARGSQPLQLGDLPASRGGTHQKINEAIKLIVNVACEELDIDVQPLGSTTLRRLDFQQGVEPDSSFYFRVTDRDPAVDPPDLMVEVEISRPAIDKLPIFARLGVQEVWRCGVQGVIILRLTGDGYVESDRSSLLPLGAVGLSHQLAQRNRLKQNAWLRAVRSWVRDSGAASM